MVVVTSACVEVGFGFVSAVPGCKSERSAVPGVVTVHSDSTEVCGDPEVSLHALSYRSAQDMPADPDPVEEAGATCEPDAQVSQQAL